VVDSAYMTSNTGIKQKVIEILSEIWTREYFDKDYVNEINSLHTVNCRKTIKTNSDNQCPIIARLRITYEMDKIALPISEANTS